MQDDTSSYRSAFIIGLYYITNTLHRWRVLHRKYVPFAVPIFFVVVVLIRVTASCSLEYSVNKPLVDSIPGATLEWWHIFTYTEYWTWLFVYIPPLFTQIVITMLIIVYNVFAIVIALIIHFDQKQPPSERVF